MGHCIHPNAPVGGVEDRTPVTVSLRFRKQLFGYRYSGYAGTLVVLGSIISATPIVVFAPLVFAAPVLVFAPFLPFGIGCRFDRLRKLGVIANCTFLKGFPKKVLLSYRRTSYRGNYRRMNA